MNLSLLLKIIVTIFGLSLFITSANAGAMFTEWGMTEKQVLSSKEVNNKIKNLKKERTKPPTSLVGDYKINHIPIKVSYVFDKTGKLSNINLMPQKYIENMDDSELDREFVSMMLEIYKEKYGTPEVSSIGRGEVAKKYIWNDRKANNRIALVDHHKGVVSLAFVTIFDLIRHEKMNQKAREGF